MTSKFWLCTMVCLCLLCTFVSADDSSSTAITAVITDQFFVSADDEPPKHVEHNRGKLIMPVSFNSVIYIKIDNAKRAHDLSGLRALIKWDEEPPPPIIPTIEYKKVFDNDGNSLGFTYLVAIDLNQFPSQYYSYKISGEVMVAPRISGSFKSQRFSIIVHGDESKVPPKKIDYNSNEPVFIPDNNIQNVLMYFEDDACLLFSADNMWEANFTFSTAIDDRMVMMYPNSQLKFIGWTHLPIFNHRTSVYIYAPQDYFLYQQINQNIIPIQYTYSQESEAMIIKTMALGRYIISNVPLENPQFVDIKKNPQTGIST